MNRIGSALFVVSMAGVVLGLSACAGARPAADPAALEGVEWRLTESSMSSTDLGAAGITASFDGKNVSGTSGVNQYGGPYTAKADGSFKVGELRSTLMAGPEPLMKAESAYLELLKQADSFSVKDDKLTLSTGAQELLIYEASMQAGLPGSSWVVTGYNNGKEAVVGVESSATLTLEFKEDETVSGSGGVNTFNGPFESTEKTVKIGPLASTEMAGPEKLMTQEALYLAALQKAATWAMEGGKLVMRDATGATQITATSK